MANNINDITKDNPGTYPNGLGVVIGPDYFGVIVDLDHPGFLMEFPGTGSDLAVTAFMKGVELCVHGQLPVEC